MAAIGTAWADGAWNVASWNTARPCWAGGAGVPAAPTVTTQPGVRGRPPYPRRLQIFGKRYWVRSLEEEKALLRRLYAEEEAKLERKPEGKQAKATRYKIRRAKTRLEKVDKREAHERLLRQWDEEILWFM